MSAERRAAAYSRPVVPGTVLYESFAGNGALDNPEAIFRELLASPAHAHLRHVWVLDRHAGRPFTAEFAGDRRVRFVRYRSARYFAALARSQYLINNATFPPEFQKRDEQTYVNTWHGTPLKTMGYEMPDGAFEAANTLRNFVAADVLVAQNPTMTRMYREAYKLDGIFRGRILESGYPRTDRQLLTDADRAKARAALLAAGVETDGRILVVYAPTWKGTSFTSPRDDAEALLDTVDELQRRLGARYRVALKAHQAVHRVVAAQGHRRLIPNDLPTNVVLGLTDVLITDYSSIFFDFLSTGRPIVFYTPDDEDYAQERGTSPLGALPGSTATTIDELARAVEAEPDPEIVARAARWRRDFTPSDDGRATRRVIDAVFGPAPDAAAATGPASGRRSLLVYLGGMRSNGITTSALNLLAHLDHSRLDVSVVLARPRSQDQRANAARIDPRIRQFHRLGAPNARKWTTIASRVRGRIGPRWSSEPAWDDRLWSSEWQRVFGQARFDAVVDFSGYSRPWTQLILHSPPAHRAIWLHNDMAAEVNRMVGGRRRMRHSLPAVFALYPGFDDLVSVSRDLAIVNAEQLADRYGVPRERFVSAANVIDEVGALAKLRDALVGAAEFVDPETGTVALPGWVGELSRSAGLRWFVTVGRSSPEKNHARLLDAFALVRQRHPDARLLIVGDGPLRSLLAAKIESLGLTEVAFLTGALANPFPVLAAADCFVLSSDYEGQPMVLLEAAVARLPIVSVRFGSVSDALPDGQMHIVDQTVEALAAGMVDYLAGAVPRAALDAAAYNRRALREFAEAVGVESESEARQLHPQTDAGA